MIIWQFNVKCFTCLSYMQCITLPYDVGPARVFLGEAEKTPCGLALHRGSMYYNEYARGDLFIRRKYKSQSSKIKLNQAQFSINAIAT